MFLRDTFMAAVTIVCFLGCLWNVSAVHSSDSGDGCEYNDLSTCSVYFYPSPLSHGRESGGGDGDGGGGGGASDFPPLGTSVTGGCRTGDVLGTGVETVHRSHLPCQLTQGSYHRDTCCVSLVEVERAGIFVSRRMKKEIPVNTTDVLFSCRRYTNCRSEGGGGGGGGGGGERSTLSGDVYSMVIIIVVSCTFVLCLGILYLILAICTRRKHLRALEAAANDGDTTVLSKVEDDFIDEEEQEDEEALAATPAQHDDAAASWREG